MEEGTFMINFSNEIRFAFLWISTKLIVASIIDIRTVVILFPYSIPGSGSL